MRRQYTPRIEVPCSICGQPFMARPSHLRRTLQPTCSLECWQSRHDNIEWVHRQFWNRVNRTDGCWEWTGTRLAKESSDYGIFSIASKRVLAHRYSWELHNGPIPDGLHVLHHCDNPPCVRPDHLFIGTPLDNARDMVVKGRGKPPAVRRGEAATRAKLTADDVRAIRDAYETGTISIRQLTRDYGVNRRAIQLVVRRMSWKHIP